MQLLAASLWVISCLIAHALPAPQASYTGCDTTLPTTPFQIAAIPQFANYSLIGLTTTTGGSGLVLIPTADEGFDGAANFTYDPDTQRLQTNGAPVVQTTYTSVNLIDSQALSFSPDAQDGTGDAGYIADAACDGQPYFVKNDESSVGPYGWTLCNQGAAGWVGTSTTEECEKVALKVFINTTATASS